MSIDLSAPATYEQLAAYNSLNNALFELAEAYDVDPAKFMPDARWSLQYKIEDLVKDKTIKPAESPSDDSAKPLETKHDRDLDLDKPVNLDDIPF